MLKVLRVLITREGEKSVALSLEHFVVAEGANDKDAVDELGAKLKAHLDLGDYDTVPEAPREKITLYESLARRSTTIRGDFMMHLRAAY